MRILPSRQSKNCYSVFIRKEERSQYSIAQPLTCPSSLGSRMGPEFFLSLTTTPELFSLLGLCSDYGRAVLCWDQELAANNRSLPKIAVLKWKCVLTMSSCYFLSGMLLLVNEGEDCQWQLDNYPQPQSTGVTFSHKLASVSMVTQKQSYFSDASQQQEHDYKLCQEAGVTPLDRGERAPNT